VNVKESMDGGPQHAIIPSSNGGTAMG